MRPTPVEFSPGFQSNSFIDSLDTGAVAKAGAGVSKTPRILLATTGQLPSTARLAMELLDAGADVSLISPRNHPGRALGSLASREIYRAAAPQRCLEAALLKIQPDIVIPCDERTVRDLHAICKQTQNARVRSLIEQSTSPSTTFPTVTSRAALLELARNQGVRVPDSVPLPDVSALDRWLQDHKAPFVLKADGSWAGFGVRIISNASAAKEAYYQMIQPITARLAIRESLLEGNHFDIRTWLKRQKPAMSAQGFVDGWPANIGVACWQGEVLATICAESVATTSPTGASTIARIINNPEMVDAAKRVVKALGLSGMVGFDFMIEAATGAAYLIEMNPRNTPVCAIRLGQGRDLAEALAARVAGRKVQQRRARTEQDIVVYFPDTWREDPTNEFLRSGYHDVPWEEPDLVRLLMLPERRDRYAVLRMLRRLWLSAQARAATPT